MSRERRTRPVVEAQEARALRGEPDAHPGPILPAIDMERFERERGLLPPFPEILNRIDALLRSGMADISQVSEIVASEVSLVARVLRVVNSAYYSIPRQIADIKQAVAFLGFREIHRIVLVTSVAEAFKDANPLHLRRFWIHSYYTALIAKELSRRYDKHADPGTLWTSALLHDVGELVYMKLYGEHYAALLQYQLSEHASLDEAEDALSLPSHRELGAELARHWGLPDSVLDACLYHGQLEPAVPPRDEAERSIRVLIGAADLLAVLAVDTLRPDLETIYREQTRALLGVEESDLMRLMGDVLDLREEVDRLTSE